VITIKVSGATVAQRRLQTMRDGAERLGNTRILVGSNLKYAFGIEFGRHRGGRLARSAGGAFFLKKGLDSIKDSLPRDIGNALANGSSVYDAMLKNALQLQNVAMANTPVNTGSLRRSLHTVTTRR